MLARDEGEGFSSIEDFRAGYRKACALEGVSIADDDVMGCIWFCLLRPAQDA